MKEEALFNQAKICLDQGNYEQAIALLESLTEITFNTEIEIYRGLIYLLKDDIETAQQIWLGLFLSQDFDSVLAEILNSTLMDTIGVFLQKTPPNLSSALQIFEALQIINEGESISVKAVDELVISYKKEALLLALAQKLEEAKERYEAILPFAKDDEEILYQLGMVYFELTDYELAELMVVKALEINRESGLYYEGLGLILEKREQFDSAIKAYSIALDKEPKNPDIYIKLANLLKRFSQIKEAQEVYENSQTNNVEHFGIYINYGNLLMDNEQYEAAIEMYKKASYLQPDFPDIYHNLALAHDALDREVEAKLYYGRAAYHEGKIEEAFVYFEEYRQSEFADLDFYNELGNYYQAKIKYAELIPIVQKAIKLYPESIRQRIYLIDAYKKTNQPDRAIDTVNESVGFFVNQEEKQIIFEVLRAGIVPVIYNSENEIEEFRQKYTSNLKSLEARLRQTKSFNRNYLLFALRNQHNYNLHFNNQNDLSVQSSYCQIVYLILARLYPKHTKKLPLNTQTASKIRVGYICYRSYSLGQLFVEWIKGHNRNLFEIYFYDIGEHIDQNTEKFRVYADHYLHSTEGFEAITKKVLSDQLDILVFLDIGICPLLLCLSVLRLAPIQCNTWGHPITSGSPNIDYFLGSDAMEPDNGQDHYSEKLIRLPNMGISFPAPELPKILKTRHKLDLKDDEILFISCQMTPKYLPQHDYLLCEIAEKVPRCKILFSDSESGEEINKRFKNRLKQKFDEYHLDFESVCQFRPRVNKDDYLNLLYVADGFLDTIGWSGGLTSMDAIACYLPIVALPGEFMRGRQSYGMLKIIGVTETVAKDERDYIDIAVRLGLDPEWRNQIKEKLRANFHKLFDDISCVKELENFYQQTIKEVLVSQGFTD
jgi:predicted O-linked N-acetylglucosamine transferase (SPINDLY family)